MVNAYSFRSRVSVDVYRSVFGHVYMKRAVKEVDSVKVADNELTAGEN
jgi:hypothetical protein